MVRDDFNRIMRTLNDTFGGFTPASYDTWYTVFEQYEYGKVISAVWKIVESMKTKPRIADILEAMGTGTVGGGSGMIETGCGMCSSGWVMVEMGPGVMVSMRCMCEHGAKLNHKFEVLDDSHIKARRMNIHGELVFYDAVQVERENKIMQMAHEQKIAWCKKGLAAMASRW